MNDGISRLRWPRPRAAFAVRPALGVSARAKPEAAYDYAEPFSALKK